MNLFAALLVAFVISWDASPDPTVTGYRVKYGAASGNYTTTVATGTATLAVIADPPAGAAYFAVVTAHTKDGIESLPSDEVSFAGPANSSQVKLTFRDLDSSVRWMPEQSSAVNVFAKYEPRNDEEKARILSGKTNGVPTNYFMTFSPWMPCEYRMHVSREPARPDRPRGTVRADFLVPISRSPQFFIRLRAQ